jgi:DNA-binding GntR family transcriptional regulator
VIYCAEAVTRASIDRNHRLPPSESTYTLKERAYSSIRRMIETGELRRGTRVSNRKVAKQLKMSAIPVREAITQMVGEGLLDHRPGIGTYVVNPSRIEIEDIYELREVLESYAARRAAQVSGDRGLAEMKQTIELIRRIKELGERTDSQEELTNLGERSAAADTSFHMAILRRAGNLLAMRTVTGLRLISRVFNQGQPAVRLRGIDVVINEHTAILETIERGDARLAGKLMRLHIRGGCRHALQQYDERQREAVNTVNDAALLKDLVDEYIRDDDE